MTIAQTRAFRNRANLMRSQLGVDTPKLLPTSAISHRHIAVPGFVGENYRPPDMCLVSVNPAGGKDAYQSSRGDDQIYCAADALAKADDVQMEGALTAAAAAFVDAMPSWGSQWRHVKDILNAINRSLDEIAYVYLVPFRTRGDSGYTIAAPVLNASFASGFVELMTAVAPCLVIAMDRPSEAAARKWTQTGGGDVVYYPRKLDDHAGRATVLDRLRRMALPCEAVTP